MKRTLYVCLIGLWCGACGAPVESSNDSESILGEQGESALAPGETASSNPNLEVLQRFTADDVTYEISSSGPESFLLSAEGSFGSGLPHTRLEGDGPFTLLETYLALAPEGAPDTRLVDYHELEARALQRADVSVRIPYLNPETRLDKDLLGDCKQGALNLLPSASGANLAETLTGIYWAAGAIGWGSPDSVNPVDTILCNWGSGAAPAQYSLEYKYKSESNYSYLGPIKTLAVNKYAFIRWGTTSSEKQVRISAKHTGSGSIPMAAAYYTQL